MSEDDLKEEIEILSARLESLQRRMAAKDSCELPEQSDFSLHGTIQHARECLRSMQVTTVNEMLMRKALRDLCLACEVIVRGLAVRNSIPEAQQNE